VAIALAWVFDVGPEGIERTAERGSEAPPPTPLPTETAAAANPSGALAQTAPAPPPAKATPTPASVAVLPFVDLSPEKDQKYFSDGLTEELLNVLAQVPGLRVPARTSSFAFKGKNTNIEEIGQILKVRTVLEGSVRTWKNQLVITAQLIEVENGYHLWSDTYDRRLEEVFAVQREIARSIVQTLKGKLLGEEETPEVKEATTDPESYQLYLKGWHFYNRFSADNARKALALFEQATQRDSTFARAWAGLANTWMRLVYLGALARSGGAAAGTGGGRAGASAGAAAGGRVHLARPHRVQSARLHRGRARSASGPEAERRLRSGAQ
jgi:adenylate cyclase